MVTALSQGSSAASRPAVLRWVLALCFCAPLHGAMAQSGLADPTRPPTVARSAGASVAADAGTPVLQSILIGRDRRSAVISGETVTVGARYGAMRVVQIGETEVVLKGGDGLTTLKLFPEVEKKVHRGGAPLGGKSERSRTGAASGKRHHAG